MQARSILRKLLKQIYSYGVVLKGAAKDGTFDGGYKIKLFTANGESTIYSFKDDPKTETINKTTDGALVQYKLNSKNEITEINTTNKTTKKTEYREWE